MHLLIILVVLILNPAQYITTDKQDIYYCGYEQTCLNNIVDDERHSDTCCQKCECEDVCKERGTCCADKDGRNVTDNVVKQHCKRASFLPKGIISSIEQWYYTRTHCPATFTDATIKDKCERDTNKSLEEVIFASSKDGSIVYKNKFCGICHGEKRTVPWTVKMYRGCMRMINKEDITEADVNEILLTRCDLYFKRPHGLNIATICFDNTVNECNKTGRWEKYDKRLESLCLHPSENVFYFGTKQTVYSNLYCYLCNTPAHVDPETCRLYQMEDRFVYNNMLSLVDPNKWSESSEDTIRNEAKQPERCRRNQVLDTFFDTCRTLYCPKLFLPINGQCVGLVDDLTFLQSVHLIPKQRLNKTEPVQNGLKTQLIDIIRQVGFGKCELCFASLYLMKSTEELEFVHIEFSVATKALCEAKAILATLTEIERVSFTVELLLNEFFIPFKVVLVNEFYQNKNKLKPIKEVGNIMDCIPSITEQGSSCPKVKLSTDEYRTVLSHYNNTDELLFIPSNDSMYVCCDNYIVHPRTSGGNEQSSAISVLILFFATHSTGKLLMRQR